MLVRRYWPAIASHTRALQVQHLIGHQEALRIFKSAMESPVVHRQA
jgi:hypothetical protein